MNEALSQLRRKSALIIPLDTALDSNGHEPADWIEDDPDGRPERNAMRGEIRRLIEARIDLLPDAFRIVFMLRTVEEMNVEEVAVALDLPEATVRTRYFRARGLLREGLSREIDVAVGDAFSFDGDRCDRIVARVLSRLHQE